MADTAIIGYPGPPVHHVWAVGDIITDCNGVDWYCTVAGKADIGGSAQFRSASTVITPAQLAAIETDLAGVFVPYFPGVVAGDSTKDYGLVINAYMAAMVTAGKSGDTPPLPPGLIYTQTEVIPPTGIYLNGSGWGQVGPTPSGTTLLPGAPAMARVASISNSGSGFKNMNVSGLGHNLANVAGIAFGVYALGGYIREFGAYGGSATTFDSSGAADRLNMLAFEIDTSAGAPPPATSTTLAINAQGADWVCTLGRIVNGTKVMSGDQSMWTAVHMTSASGGNAAGSNANVVDQGGQHFAACEFDSLPSNTCTAMIDRTGASKASVYNGCRGMQSTNNITGMPFLLETTVGGGGVEINGLSVIFASGAAASSFTYAIQGAIASTQVNNLNMHQALATAFTDATPPLGTFSGCVANNTPAALGGFTLGTNAPPGSVAFFSPAAPTATASTTAVMMGLGATIAYTPKSTGKVRVIINGVVGNLTAAVAVTGSGRYGTGTAPANGVAFTGTAFPSGTKNWKSNGTPPALDFTILGLISGLAIGTAYWFDLAISTATGADVAEVLNLAVTVEEVT